MGASGSAKSDEQVQRLEVRVRRILDADGGASESASVYCPRREHAVDIDRCAACERGGGLHFDPASHKTFVNCRLGAEGDGGRAAAALDATTPIAELMTKAVVCVRPETSAEELMTLFLERGISGVPVVDDAGRPVGMVSKTDLLRAERDRGDTAEIERGREPRAPDGFHVTEVARWLMKDVMTPAVLALNEREHVGHAAALMAYEGVHHLPVLSDGGEVVGMLSSLDVLRWLGRRSGYVIPDHGPRR
jgi:CBS domain-containing protein